MAEAREEEGRTWQGSRVRAAHTGQEAGQEGQGLRQQGQGRAGAGQEGQGADLAHEGLVGIAELAEVHECFHHRLLQRLFCLFFRVLMPVDVPARPRLQHCLHSQHCFCGTCTIISAAPPIFPVKNIPAASF